MSKQEIGKKMFYLVINDIQEKGLNVKKLPKDYPLRMGVIYRMRYGDYTKRTLEKIESLKLEPCQ